MMSKKCDVFGEPKGEDTRLSIRREDAISRSEKRRGEKGNRPGSLGGKHSPCCSAQGGKKEGRGDPRRRGGERCISNRMGKGEGLNRMRKGGEGKESELLIPEVFEHIGEEGGEGGRAVASQRGGEAAFSPRSKGHRI